VQWMWMTPSDRPADMTMYIRRPVQALEQILVRGPLVAQCGQNGTEPLLKVIDLPLALWWPRRQVTTRERSGLAIRSPRVRRVHARGVRGRHDLLPEDRPALLLSPCWRVRSTGGYALAAQAGVRDNQLGHDAPTPLRRTTLAGTPAATLFGGMSLVTTAPAAMIAPSPMVTPATTTTLTPSQV
jgi:hypothetical protein